MKTLLFINRSITSKYNKSLIEQLGFLRNREYIIHVTSTKTDSATNYIESTSGIKISRTISTNSRYHEEVKSGKYASWVDFLDNEDWFSEFYNEPVEVIIWGGYLSNATTINRDGLFISKMLSSKKQMKYVSNGIQLSLGLQLVKLSKMHAESSLSEFCYDHQEESLNTIKHESFSLPHKYNLYHGFNNEEYGFKRLDSLQHYLESIRDDFFKAPEISTKYNCTFGMAVLLKSREYVYEDLKGLFPIIDNLYIKHKYLGIDNFVDRDRYIEKIAQSKYTIIVPPYDPHSISIFRIIESVEYECLPLFYGDMRYDLLEQFGIGEDLLSKLKIKKSATKLPDMSEPERLGLLKELKDKLFKDKGYRDIC